MANDLTTMAFIYKRKFMGAALEELVMRDHVRFKLMNKKPGFVGADGAYSILTGNPQGISGDFASAQSAESPSFGKQPVATRAAKYGVVRMEHQAILAAAGNDGAFYDLVVRSTNGMAMEFGDTLAFDLYGDGTGVRGQRASISTNVVTLAVANNTRNFKQGMTVIASPNADGSSPRTGSTTVASVGTTTITLTSAAAITAFADNDFLFRLGDPGTCIQGLAKCTPLTEPTAGDSFRGIDRSNNVPLLAGSRVNNTLATIEENLGLGAITCQSAGVMNTPTQAFLHPVNFFQVARRQGAQVMYTSDKTRANIGFQYIDVTTATGTMRVYSDPDCQTTLGWGENPTEDYIWHLGEYPHVVMNGKEPMLAMGTALAFESRSAAFGQYIQQVPGAHFVIAI